MVWGFKTLATPVSWLLRRAFVLGDEPAEDGSALDPLVGRVDGRPVGSWRLQVE